MVKSTTTKKSTSGKKTGSHWSENRSAPVDKTKRFANATISVENIVTGTRKRKAVDYRDHKVIKTSKKVKTPTSLNTLEKRRKKEDTKSAKKEKPSKN